MGLGNGNSKSGDKGSGFAYQMRHLTILGDIFKKISLIGTPIVSITPAMLRVVAPGLGSVSNGKRRVSFFNAGSTDSLVLGSTLKAGEFISFSADGIRDVLSDFSYDALTSELVITTVG